MRSLPRASLGTITLAMLLACCVAWTPAATAAPGGVRIVRDVRVPTSDGASITVDVWRTRSTRRPGQARPTRRAVQPRLRPVALLVHGGGWHSGDKRQWEQSRWAQRLSQRGWLVVNANYRLACTAPARAARDPQLCGHAMRTSIADVRSALRFTSKHARGWGGNPARIVLFGASAGGQLAMLAASERGRPAGVRAVVAIGPPVDLEWVGGRPSLPIHASAALSIGCGLASCRPAWQAASPIAHVRRGTTPPTLLFASGADPITPAEPVRRYVERLRAGGIRATFLTTADAASQCHGPIPCETVPLAGTGFGLFQQTQAWLAPYLR